VSVKLTKRGKRVRALVIALGLVAIYLLSIKVHYTGAGYCLGTFEKCYALEREGE
jgi:hypothetical protein